ncbi:MAG: hypothetical protein HYV07_10200 [Deltaproteobacteria bacterium]|nr:hypothetical protein [Deltaproteobacteria bacterium]
MRLGRRFLSRASSVLLTLLTLSARAEEGLVVGRFGGGVGAVSGTGAVGPALVLSSDYAVTDRFGPILGLSYAAIEGQKRLGMGLGLKATIVEAFWRRLFLHVGPELLLEWTGQATVRADLSLRAGLAYEELLFWGTGLFLEAFAQLPLRVSDEPRIEELSAGGTAGLFLEF